MHPGTKGSGARFDQAAEAYSRAIEELGDHGGDLRVALLNNRAACSQQLGDWSAVRKDASAVLAAEPQNLKVRWRATGVHGDSFLRRHPSMSGLPG